MMAPAFNIVVSSECTADDIHLLRRFQCCDIGSDPHEWEIEHQRHIRGLTRSDFDADVKRMILTTESRLKIFAFAEYGYLEESRTYSIAWIARDISCTGNHLGESLLGIVVDEMAIDSYLHHRGNQVVAQISPQNERSKRMAESQRFRDCGVDSTDSGFHIWLSTFIPHPNAKVQRQFITRNLLHPHGSAS